MWVMVPAIVTRERGKLRLTCEGSVLGRGPIVAVAAASAVALSMVVSPVRVEAQAAPFTASMPDGTVFTISAAVPLGPNSGVANPLPACFPKGRPCNLDGTDVEFDNAVLTGGGQQLRFHGVSLGLRPFPFDPGPLGWSKVVSQTGAGCTAQLYTTTVDPLVFSDAASGVPYQPLQWTWPTNTPTTRAQTCVATEGVGVGFSNQGHRYLTPHTSSPALPAPSGVLTMHELGDSPSNGRVVGPFSTSGSGFTVTYPYQAEGRYVVVGSNPNGHGPGGAGSPAGLTIVDSSTCPSVADPSADWRRCTGIIDVDLPASMGAAPAVGGYSDGQINVVTWNSSLTSRNLMTISYDQSSVDPDLLRIRNGALDWTGIRVTTLGDSFTSGEGASTADRSFLHQDLPSGVTTNTDNGTDTCHRTNNAWPTRLGEVTGASVTNLACSGATSADLLVGSGGEPAQVSRLASTHPDLVMVSAGGNDMGFDGFVTSCFLGSTSCAGDSAQWLQAAQDVEPALADHFAAVKAAAGPVPVVAVGYPLVVNVDQGRTCGPLSLSERLLADNVVTTLNDSLRRAAQQSGLYYLDVVHALDGYRLCDGSVTWVNSIKARNPAYTDDEATSTRSLVVKAIDAVTPDSGDIRFLTTWPWKRWSQIKAVASQSTRESAHPNRDGHLAMAATIQLGLVNLVTSTGLVTTCDGRTVTGPCPVATGNSLSEGHLIDLQDPDQVTRHLLSSTSVYLQPGSNYTVTIQDSAGAILTTTSGRASPYGSPLKVIQLPAASLQVPSAVGSHTASQSAIGVASMTPGLVNITLVGTSASGTPVTSSVTTYNRYSLTDADGDGYLDDVEETAGSDPWRADSTPVSVSPMSLTVLPADPTTTKLLQDLAAKIPQLTVLLQNAAVGTIDIPGCSAPSVAVPADASGYTAMLRGERYTARGGIEAGPLTPECTPGVIAGQQR
jgi:lysophospholipase L1-like esterase